MERIEHLMQVLDLTEEEAKQVLADDDAIATSPAVAEPATTTPAAYRHSRPF